MKVCDLQAKMVFTDVRIVGLGEIYSAEVYYTGNGYAIPYDHRVCNMQVSSISCHVFDGKPYVVLSVW